MWWWVADVESGAYYAYVSISTTSSTPQIASCLVQKFFVRRGEMWWWVADVESGAYYTYVSISTTSPTPQIASYLAQAISILGRNFSLEEVRCGGGSQMLKAEHTIRM